MISKQKMYTVRCSLCRENMCVDHEKYEIAMVYNGAINWFTIGYGSKFDGEEWMIALCDTCLTILTPIKVKQYLTTKEEIKE